MEGQQPPPGGDQPKAPFDARRWLEENKAEIEAGVAKRTEESNKRKEGVVEFLNETEQDSKIDSPRFQAYCDYVDVELAGGMGESKTLKQALIQETIRQRRNGVLGYDDEFGEVEKREKEYENNFQNMHKINNIGMTLEEQKKARVIAEWKSVKEQEIKKRNQQYKKPPQQLETPNPTATLPSEPPTQK